MKPIYFISENREIISSNVANLYGRIGKDGFIPAAGTIDLMKGDKLKDSTIYKVTVVKKNEPRKWSLTNWKLEYEVVPYSDEIEAVADGQHKSIACELLRLIDGKDVYDEQNYRIIEIPEHFSIAKFLEMKNAVEPWNRDIIDKKGLPTGSVFLDAIIKVATDAGLKSQVVVDWSTSKTTAITGQMIANFRSGLKECKVQLTQDDVDAGKKILEAFKPNQSTDKSFYNSTRVSAGIRLFAKEYGIDAVVSVINSITKAEKESVLTPAKGVSAEAKFYQEAFETMYNNLRKEEEYV